MVCKTTPSTQNKVIKHETRCWMTKFSSHRETFSMSNLYCGIHTLGQLSRLYVLILLEETNKNRSTHPHRVVILNIASKFSAQPCSPNQTHLLQWTNYQKNVLGELKFHLKKRGIKHCFNKASGIDRKYLIQYKDNNTNNRVSFVTTYHP